MVCITGRVHAGEKHPCNNHIDNTITGQLGPMSSYSHQDPISVHLQRVVGTPSAETMSSSFSGFSNKFNVHYFAFKICDLSALESMRVLFERIRNALWSSEERYPLVHRTKFNARFRNLNLWAVDFGYADIRKLGEVFEKFTQDLGGTLHAVSIKFTDIDCERYKGKIYVRLKPDSESSGVLRRIQGDLILRFGGFQRPGFVNLYDPSCNLLYLDTEIAFQEVESIVRKCFSQFGHFEVRSGPFLLCQACEIIHQYPISPRVYSGHTSDTPEWITRSLCIFNIPSDCGIDSSEIIISLAALIQFELEDITIIESCGPRIDYYTAIHRKRIVAVFRTISLRDSFYRIYKRYLSRHDWRISTCDVIKGLPEKDIFVRKALPAYEDRLFSLAHRVCCFSLSDYRASMDETTFALYLEQRDEPRWQYYFNTLEELNDLADLLRYGGGTEYLSSVW